MMGFLLKSIIIFLTCFIVNSECKPKNIVFIVADDLGWNDVGFHNPDMITPNIDRLAAEGVKLGSAYVQPACSPSRHSWMTGTYPFKHGIQRAAIFPQHAHCSPYDLSFLPQELKSLGYDTHIAGKWHLGFCNWKCTPTYRGFDSFLGYYNGQEDYYNKTLLGGIDFREGEKPVNNTVYSPLTYAKRAVDIINAQNQQKPLFLYLPFQSVHAPIQVPKHYEDMYPNIKTEGRRKYCGMVSALDEAVGKVINALEQKGILKETLIIFTTDNGGMPTQFGNNYPLRGGKTTIFEGGTRAVAFVYGAGLQEKGYTYNGLMHAIDWFPTILAAASGTERNNSKIDGINMWEAISQNKDSERKEMIYNLDSHFFPVTGYAAIRVGDYKLIEGFPGIFQGWYKPDEYFKSEFDQTDEQALFKKIGSAMTRFEGIMGDGLYNLKHDPNERNDISKEHPDIVAELKGKLKEYRKMMVSPKHYKNDPAAAPSNYGGYWSPGWC